MLGDVGIVDLYQIYQHQIKEKYRTRRDRNNQNKLISIIQCIMVNISVIWQQGAHTTYNS